MQQVVGARRGKPGQGIHELAHAGAGQRVTGCIQRGERAVGIVGGGAEVVGYPARIQNAGSLGADPGFFVGGLEAIGGGLSFCRGDFTVQGAAANGLFGRGLALVFGDYLPGGSKGHRSNDQERHQDIQELATKHDILLNKNKWMWLSSRLFSGSFLVELGLRGRRLDNCAGEDRKQQDLPGADHNRSKIRLRLKLRVFSGFLNNPSTPPL